MPTARPKPAASPARYTGRFVAIDPSSRAIGWALFDGGELVRCGSAHSKRPDEESRVRLLMATVEGSLYGCRAELAVIEHASGLIAKGFRANGAVTLAFWQGFVYGRLIRFGFDPVERVRDVEWTNSFRIKGKVAKKPERVTVVMGLYPTLAAYCRATPGEESRGDAADAVGLGDWWINKGHAKRLAGPPRSQTA